VIGRLTGNVLECAPDRVLLDVSGVGYLVLIPLSTYYGISAAGAEPVSLHVHTHVREDILQLYGFGSREERSAFEVLIGVNGVGPRMALAVLSGIGVDELRLAVEEQDRARLQQIPGVGRKTAERMLLELQDRLERVAGTATSDRTDVPAGQTGSAVPVRTARADALSALTNLGYSRDRAERAVTAAERSLGDTPSLEALLKTALGRLVQ